MRTSKTFKMDNDFWIEVKRTARKQGLKLYALIEIALKNYIDTYNEANSDHE